MKPLVGIVGGMGPRATVLFQDRILSRSRGSDQSLPALHVINDGSIPDRSSFVLGAGDDPAPAIQAAISMLEQQGCSVLCMPCNTAHAEQILGRLHFNAGTQLLHMPELTVQEIARLGCKRTAILATEGTIAAGLYQQLCTQRQISYVAPSAAIQASVTQIIKQIKRADHNDLDVVLGKLRTFLIEAGVDSVILGCTELSFIADQLPSHIFTVDTLDVLADAVLAKTSVNERMLL